jgi:hypothetical protein
LPVAGCADDEIALLKGGGCEIPVMNQTFDFCFSFVAFSFLLFRYQFVTAFAVAARVARSQ